MTTIKKQLVQVELKFPLKREPKKSIKLKPKNHE